MKKRKQTKKQYSLLKVPQIARHLIYKEPLPELRDIETCKTEIESWYDPDSDNFNSFLVRHEADENKANKKLQMLKDLKSRREKFYTDTDENKKILNLICEYPDITVFKLGPNKDTLGPMLLREYYDRRTENAKRSFNEYRIKLEEKACEANDELAKKLPFFSLRKAFEISIDPEINKFFNTPLDGYLPTEMGIHRVYKELSVILFPSLLNRYPRAKKISEIIQLFYGISKSEIDIDRIRQQIKDEVL